MTESPQSPTVLGPGAGALDRGLAMLDHLATVRSCTTSDLARVLGLSRSTTYRLVDRLVKGGWLASDPATGNLRLGPSTARLAGAALGSVDLRSAAVPVIARLVRQTRETASLAVPNGLAMVFVHRERGPRPVAVTDEIGASRPFHSTSVGRAYLAALPDAQLDEQLDTLLRAADSPLHEGMIAELRATLERTRRRGWSEDRREFDESSCCCGAPVYDHTGRPIAAISVAGVAERMEHVMDDIGHLVAAAAAEVSAALGHARTAI
ncbi:IclR family transcriptional regulator [Actinomadura vinacea]|uniref:IclR family transcriptional regulator n=1 Tax=Actinomadura vinacea TaxID=115336 RepID=A0ABN3IRJ2_9ACTN